MKAEWGVEEVGLHQGITAGTFMDLDMHLEESLAWGLVSQTVSTTSQCWPMNHQHPTKRATQMDTRM